MRMRRTTERRAADTQLAADVESLALGEVIQVFSRYSEVLCDGATYLASLRGTVQKLTHMAVVVGDMVRLRPSGRAHESGMPEAVIEHVLPRVTVLVRQDSFRKDRADPIVANAQQMLIVSSILLPKVKWGLVDRMLIAAQSGGLDPIICLNKMDLAVGNAELTAETSAILAHYNALGIRSIECSATSDIGAEELKAALMAHKTVLAGHSGVGKSSLIRTVAPELDIRVGEVSTFNEKGRHTTSSARRYVLPFGGEVIDTPGIKFFGLVDVTRESLAQFFPDVEAGEAPEWRRESYQRIRESL